MNRLQVESSECQIRTLQEISLRITDGTHITPKYLASGVPFLSVKNVREDGIDFDNVKYISTEEHNLLTKRSKPEKGDILLTKVGTIGIARAIESDREFSIFVSVALIKPKRDIVDPKFLEFALNSPSVRQQFFKRLKGIAVPDLHLEEIRLVTVPVPPLQTQRRIADVLAKTEQLKQERKKANLISGQILESFFSKMFEAEGFPVYPIGNYVFDTETRNPYSKPNDFFKYIDISGVDNVSGQIAKYKEILGKDAPSRARKVIKTDDVIVSTVRPNLNATAIVPLELDNQICSTGFSVLRCKKELNPRYLYAFTRNKNFIGYLTARMKGASYPAVTNSDVLSTPIPLPPIELQNRFSFIADKIDLVKQWQGNSSRVVNSLFNSLVSEIFGKCAGQSSLGEGSRPRGNNHSKSTELKYSYQAPRRKGVFVSIKSILSELDEEGSTIEQVFLLSGLTKQEFWDQLQKEIHSGSIEKIDTQKKTLLRVVHE